MNSAPLQCDLRISLSELEALLWPSGKRSIHEYAKDSHFETFVLHSIKTKKDALAFADVLDSERDKTYDSMDKRIQGHCQKTHTIRTWLEKPWGWEPSFQKDVDADGYMECQVKAAVAASRRTCCSCHETGSFAKRVTDLKVKENAQ